MRGLQMVFSPVIFAPHGAPCCPRSQLLNMTSCQFFVFVVKPALTFLFSSWHIPLHSDHLVELLLTTWVKPVLNPVLFFRRSFPPLKKWFCPDLFSIQPSPIFPSPFDSFTILSYFVKVFFIVADFLVRVYSGFLWWKRFLVDYFSSYSL